MLKPDDDSEPDRDNSKPLAIFARRSSPRIVAQRGVFTIHGTDEVSLQQLFKDEHSPRLAKLLIEPTVCHSMLRSLRALGVNETTLIPAAESVSKDLKRLYGIK